MPLDLGGGGFNSIRWMASTRSWVSGTEDVALEKAVFDLQNIKLGWVKLYNDIAPEFLWDDNGNRHARPDAEGDENIFGKWRRGFEVQVWAPKLFGDDEPRPFMTNATGACMGIQALYVDFEAQRDDNAGKVPLVEYTGAEAAKVGKGNTAIPQLTISKWIDRPDALQNVAPAEDEPGNDAGNDDAEF
tara:strand:- start:14 stop:577 length:564 start_codon:yes stop_codon:yes gene_type:complete